MLPFLIYLLAGTLTGIQVYALLTLGVHGAPVSPLEFLSLLGSLVLIVAAYLGLWKPRLAARVALLAALVVWSFYAPATLHAVRSWRAGQAGSQPQKGAR